EGSVLKPKYLKGEGSRLFRRTDVPLGAGVSGWVAENGKPILNDNPSVEPNYSNESGTCGCLQSAISVPMTVGSDQVLGALTLYRQAINAYTKEDLRILLAVIDKISRAVESAVQFQQA